ITWHPGQVAAQAFQGKPETVIAIEDAGDFDKNQAFSYGAWVKLTKRAQFGAILARMDDKNHYRGWDLWIENNRVGTHIIHKWDEDALKVVSNTPLKLNQWYHLFVTYDGSGQAAGVKVYVNGTPQQTTVQADKLKNTIRTEVPLKVAQRHSGQAVEGALLQDLRIYNRALSGVEVDRLMKTTRAAWLASKPADKRSPQEKDELFDWWLATSNKPYQGLAAKLAVLTQEAAAIRSRGS